MNSRKGKPTTTFNLPTFNRLLGILVAGLLLAGPTLAQSAKKVSNVKLKTSSLSKLKMDDDWKRVLKFSGDNIQPKKGFQIFKVGGVIYVTNDQVTSPPSYVVHKEGRSSNVINRGGTCVVIKDICACASTLINNMYGGNENDECRFSGSPSESSCGGEGCCSYLHDEVTVECP